MERKKCPICKKPIGRNKICCSMECYAKYKSHYKTCIVCGKKFYDAKSNDTVCCSPKCSKKHRQDLYKQGVNKAATDKMVAARYSNPKLMPSPENINAKSWIIQSPDGAVYECRNLKNWLREHEDLLDGTVNQAWDGISKIKYSMQGKRKRPCYQWKGWRLIAWSDE